jgi:hypothetical protein
MEQRVFRWACLALALIAVSTALWMLNDARLAMKGTARTVDKSLPPILQNVRRSSEVVAALAKDIQRLRDLAGVTNKARDRSLVIYADSILDLVAKQPGQIGLTKKVFGSGLKSLRPVQAWVQAARKEALWLSFRANSKRELLERLCHNKWGSKWILAVPGQKPIPLMDWLRRHHPPTTKLR